MYNAFLTTPNIQQNQDGMEIVVSGRFVCGSVFL